MVGIQEKDEEVVEEVGYAQIDDIPSSHMVMEERELIHAPVKTPLPKGKIVTPMEGITVAKITG
jgi:hypothetical protein